MKGLFQCAIDKVKALFSTRSTNSKYVKEVEHKQPLKTKRLLQTFLWLSLAVIRLRKIKEGYEMNERCALYDLKDNQIAVIYKDNLSGDLVLYDGRLFFHNSEVEQGNAFREITVVTDYEITWKA